MPTAPSRTSPRSATWTATSGPWLTRSRRAETAHPVPPRVGRAAAERRIVGPAQAICGSPEDGQAYRPLVTRQDEEIPPGQQLPGVHANIPVAECQECDAMLRRHPAVISA